MLSFFFTLTLSLLVWPLRKLPVTPCLFLTDRLTHGRFISRQTILTSSFRDPQTLYMHCARLCSTPPGPADWPHLDTRGSPGGARTQIYICQRIYRHVAHCDLLCDRCCRPIGLRRYQLFMSWAPPHNGKPLVRSEAVPPGCGGYKAGWQVQRLHPPPRLKAPLQLSWGPF